MMLPIALASFAFQHLVGWYYGTKLVPFQKHFPSELIDRIIDFLNNDLRSLRACALVCRGWLPRSRYHIFRTTVVLHSAKIGSLIELLKSPSPFPTPFLYSIPSLNYNLGADIDILRNPQTNSARPPHFADLLQHLPPLPQLTHLHFDCAARYFTLSHGLSDSAPAVEMMTRLFPHLAQLEISRATFPSLESLFRVASSFPELQELFLDRVAWGKERQEPLRLPDLPPSLHLLTIHFCPDSRGEALRWLSLNSGAHQIKHYVQKGVAVSDLEAFDALCKKIGDRVETVEFMVYADDRKAVTQNGWFEYPVFTVKEFFSSWVSLTNLRHLHIEFKSLLKPPDLCQGEHPLLKEDEYDVDDDD